MTQNYRGLEIELDKNCSGQPEIRILRSTFDRPRESFVFPAKKRREIEAKAKEFGKLLLKDNAEASRRRLAEEIGIDLYKILLPGEIGSTSRRCSDGLRRGEGLRLRLSFGQDYDHELGGLPWELICHPETRRFISNDERYSVARYLDLGERIQPLDVEAPMKILAVFSSPDAATTKRFEYCHIDKAAHQRILKRAIDPSTHLQVEFLHEKTADGWVTLHSMHRELKEAELAGAPYHAVHILCHGGFNSENEGVLLFERPDHSEHLVTARELARMLTAEVRLVVLASCNTGRIPIPRHGGRHPFAGVASALVADGKPAVLAMQFTVSEAAVAAFSQSFYRMIDEGKAVDAAVTEGRLAIEASGSEGACEWATPVLFLRSFDGKVLNLKAGKAPAKTVAIFNILNHGKDKLAHANFKIDLREYFDGRAMKEPTDWNRRVLDKLRHTLTSQLPETNPIHLEIAAPLSIAFAAGSFLAAKDRRKITLGQRDQVWDLSEGLVTTPSWLDEERSNVLIPKDFPITEDSNDIAVIVEGSRSAIDFVSTYFQRHDLAPPSVGRVIFARFENPDHFSVSSGGHARSLAASVIERVSKAARHQGHVTVHFFLACPAGLAFAIGQQAKTLERVQLYEFDFEKKRHKSYEPSITLVSMMDGNG